MTGCVGLGLLAGCPTRKVSDEDVAIATVADVKRLAADPEDPAVVIDVRSPAEYDAGHIPGAVHRRLATLGDRAFPELEDRVVVVYGPGRRGLSTVGAKRVLASEVEEPPYDFRDGFAGWVAAGEAVERSETPTPEGPAGTHPAATRPAGGR